VLIAQLSDVHVGGSRYREELLRTAIEEVNASEPDLVVVAGDLTDDGYPDQYPLAARELGALTCPRIVRVPGNRSMRPRKARPGEARECRLAGHDRRFDVRRRRPLAIPRLCS
jgi:3',5'-cyclic AMP phosphodiesterase CpdA